VVGDVFVNNDSARLVNLKIYQLNTSDVLTRMECACMRVFIMLYSTVFKKIPADAMHPNS
jgi:hypothetical protein